MYVNILSQKILKVGWNCKINLGITQLELLEIWLDLIIPKIFPTNFNFFLDKIYSFVIRNLNWSADFLQLRLYTSPKETNFKADKATLLKTYKKFDFNLAFGHKSQGLGL